jgi:hypothetical protein
MLPSRMHFLPRFISKLFFCYLICPETLPRHQFYIFVCLFSCCQLLCARNRSRSSRLFFSDFFFSVEILSIIFISFRQLFHPFHWKRALVSGLSFSIGCCQRHDFLLFFFSLSLILYDSIPNALITL